MTVGERMRCVAQIHRMATGALREMARMMEHKSKTEHEVLVIIHDELHARGVRFEDIPLGIEDAEAIPHELRIN